MCETKAHTKASPDISQHKDFMWPLKGQERSTEQYFLIRTAQSNSSDIGIA